MVSGLLISHPLRGGMLLLVEISYAVASRSYKITSYSTFNEKVEPNLYEPDSTWYEGIT